MEIKELPESPEDTCFGDSMHLDLNSKEIRAYWMRRKDGTIYRAKQLLEGE